MSSEGTYRCFSLQEILRMTNNFDEESVIGIGGFGKVYVGFYDNGDRVVAIKRLNAESKQGAGEFWTEVNMFSELQHANLVGFMGYCNESQEFILVYEYIARGTLASHLYNLNKTESKTSFSPLSWEQRLEICTGAARGLDYLHSGTSQSYIHRDVKTTNILIDENWVAKISDFGLSKGTTSHSITHISTDVKGTFGYLDPDYFMTQRLTKKSDVYAFGVVLLEVLCGRPPVDRKLDEEQIGLVYWAQRCIKRGKLAEVIDSSLNGQIAPNCLKSFVALANDCLQKSPKSRPTMAEVLGRLQLALLSQQRRRTEGIMTKALQSVRDILLRERKDNSSSSGHSKYSPLESNSITGMQLYRQFSLTYIRLATMDFNNGFLVRNSDKVYKVSLNIDGKELVVAIKRFKNLESNFRDVIHPKKLLFHPHILSPIGFCSQVDELIIVHDYMANGSLHDYLHYTDTPLSWEMRLQICVGAAQGIQYLHRNGELDLIHHCSEPSSILLDRNWDAKLDLIHHCSEPSSILLDRNWDAKLDLIRLCSEPSNILLDGNGVAKLMLSSNSQGILRSHSMHYYSFYQLDVQDSILPYDDLYSFGVTLLEVLFCDVQFGIFLLDREHSHQKPKYSDVPEKYVLKEILESENIHKVMHPHLRGKIGPKCLRHFVEIALSCLSLQGIRRPSIEEVVKSLKFAARLQEDWQSLTTGTCWVNLNFT